MFGRCYRLVDMLPSTKEFIEDLFGAGVDAQRSNKNPFKAATIDKLHHMQSFWVWLDRGQWPKIQATPQDSTKTRGAPIRRRQNIGSVGALSNFSKMYRLAAMKQQRTRGVHFKRGIFFTRLYSLFEWMLLANFFRVRIIWTCTEVFSEHFPTMKDRRKVNIHRFWSMKRQSPYPTLMPRLPAIWWTTNHGQRFRLSGPSVEATSKTLEDAGKWTHGCWVGILWKIRRTILCKLWISCLCSSLVGGWSFWREPTILLAECPRFKSDSSSTWSVALHWHVWCLESSSTKRRRRVWRGAYWSVFLGECHKARLSTKFQWSWYHVNHLICLNFTWHNLVRLLYSDPFWNPGCPSEIPEDLERPGIVFRRAGRSESLSRFWAQHGRALDAVHLYISVRQENDLGFRHRS